MSKPFNLSRLANLNVAVSPTEAERHLGEYWLVPPGSSVTVTVPGMCATLAAAFDAIRGWFGTPGAITIQVANGNYDFTTGLSPQQACPSYVRLIGNTTDPSLCRLRSDVSGIAMLSVAGTQALYVDGFTIEHLDQPSWENSMGLLADEGGWILTGGNMVIDQFYWGAQVRRNGNLRMSGAGEMTNCGDAGVLAYEGGRFDIDGWTFTDTADPDSSLGSGLVIEGGSGDISNITCTGGKRAGVHVISGYLRVNGGWCDFSDNLGPGILHDAGTIDLTDACTVGGNATYGASGNGIPGMVGIANLTDGGDANTSGLYVPHLRPLYSSQPGDQVTSPATNESRRYDTKGSGHHYFNTGGVNRLDLSSTGIGFNGTAASAKPTITGSRGGNAALASLLTQLAAMGLLTDGTSA